MNIYGYARVSSMDQREDRQLFDSSGAGTVITKNIMTVPTIFEKNNYFI